jgi:hypothetical protein
MQSWPNVRLSRNLFGGTDGKQEESQGGRAFSRQDFNTGTSEYGTGELHGMNKFYAVLLNFQTIQFMALYDINHRCHGVAYRNYLTLKTLNFAHTVYLCVFYDCHNKTIIRQSALTNCSLHWRSFLFHVRYKLNLHGLR